MKLSDLIEQTLNEIGLGILKARRDSQHRIAIAPTSLGGVYKAEITEISFDVALVVSESDDQKSVEKSGLGGQIKVATIFSAKGDIGQESQGSNSRSSQNTQRVSFKIPVCLAVDYDEATKSYDYADEQPTYGVGHSSITGY